MCFVNNDILRNIIFFSQNTLNDSGGSVAVGDNGPAAIGGGLTTIIWGPMAVGEGPMVVDGGWAAVATTIRHHQWQTSGSDGL